jgi:small GTP-binding protein
VRHAVDFDYRKDFAYVGITVGEYRMYPKFNLESNTTINNKHTTTTNKYTMGTTFTKLSHVLQWFFNGTSNKEAKLVLLGLDNAGKTTILHRFNDSSNSTTTSRTALRTIQTIPTVGFNVESVTVGRITFSVWDLGGQSCVRNIWKHYYEGVYAVIFVIDCSDCEQRLMEAKTVLQNVLCDDRLDNVPLLVYANKRDVESSKTGEEIIQELELDKLLKNRLWTLQESVGLTGEGLAEGLDWIVKSEDKLNTSSVPS